MLHSWSKECGSLLPPFLSGKQSGSVLSEPLCTSGDVQKKVCVCTLDWTADHILELHVSFSAVPSRQLMVQWGVGVGGGWGHTLNGHGPSERIKTFRTTVTTCSFHEIIITLGYEISC